jgi:hypothetical protein
MATSKRKRPAGGATRASSSRAASSARPAAKAPATKPKASTGGKVSKPAGPEDSSSASKRLFDLRWLIAGMFVIYGIVLSITGIFDSHAEIQKAAGVRINLWTGIGMFVVGLVFAAWARWRPLRPE